MSGNIFVKTLLSLRDWLVYKPPSAPPPFVLAEKVQEKPDAAAAPAAPLALAEAAEELDALLRYARRLAAALAEVKRSAGWQAGSGQIASLRQSLAGLKAQKADLAPVRLAYDSGSDPEQRNISASLAENIFIIEKLFKLPENEDIVLREVVFAANPPRRALLVFVKGLVDNKDITGAVLTPLHAVKELSGDILDTLIKLYLYSDQAQAVYDFKSIAKGISIGFTALFVEGVAGAVLIKTKGFEQRAIGRPMIEQTVRGSQTAFTETLRTNISLVRLLLRAPDLVTEMFTVGMRSQTDCAMLYLKAVANPDLVAEIKRRLGSIRTDSLVPGMLSSFIEDHPLRPLPHLLSTERPDRVAAHLTEGRIAVLADGDPFALIMPISIFTLFHSPEDYAMPFMVAVFVRILRFAGAFFAVIFPAIYIAITYYHPEVLPTDLVLTIAGARERVPFPGIVEVLFMEISFEFIREAGTRIPGVLGETLGIVGAIILGQAVVVANLVSPVVVVVVAVTALASFCVPEVRMGMGIRLIRFAFLAAALAMGLVGVAGVLFLLIIYACATKSAGVPYVAPLAPRTTAGYDVILRGPSHRQEMRPDELNTRDVRRQPPTSRPWTAGARGNKEGRPDDEL